MSSTRTIARNFFLLLTGTALTRLLTLAMVAYAARKLQVDRFGQWSFAVTVASYFWMVGHLGLDTPAARHLALHRKEADEWVGRVLPWKLLGSVAGFLMVAVVVFWLPKPVETKLLVLMCYLPLAVACWSLNWVYVGLERLELMAMAQMLEQGLNLAAVLVLIQGPEHVARMPLAIALGTGGSALVMLVVWRCLGHRYRFQFEFAPMRQMLGEGMQIVGTQAAVQLYLNCSMLFLGLVSSDAQVALYSVGYRLATPFSILRQTLIVSLNPMCWRLYVESREQFGVFVNRLVRYSACALFPAATVVMVLSATVVRLVFGVAYEGGAMAFGLLCWWLTLIFLNVSGEIILYAATRQDDVLKLSLGALGLTLVFNLWLTPQYGASGAAASMLLAEAVWLPVRFYLARRCVPIAFWRSLSKPCLCAAALGAWIWHFRNGNLLLHLPIALVLYTAGLFLTRAVVVSELCELWQALRTGKK